MITKLTSTKEIIAKVIADLDLKDDNIRISDWREWMGEAAEKIGAFHQYDHKTVILPIKNYQVPLPCDMYKLHQAAYSYYGTGAWLPMRSSTGSFNVWDKASEANRPEKFVHDAALIVLIKTMFNYTTDREALDKLNSDPNLRPVLSKLINLHTYNIDAFGRSDVNNYSLDLQYVVKPGYINVSAPDGYLKLAYDSIPTDKDGYPLVPDTASFKEAVYWYVVMKLKYPEYLAGRLHREIYYDIKRSWNYYCKQAYADMMMPNADEMQSIKNTWLKLYPEIDDHDTFYSTTGEEQVIYNQNNND